MKNILFVKFVCLVIFGSFAKADSVQDLKNYFIDYKFSGKDSFEYILEKEFSEYDVSDFIFVVDDSYRFSGESSLKAFKVFYREFTDVIEKRPRRTAYVLLKDEKFVFIDSVEKFNNFILQNQNMSMRNYKDLVYIAVLFSEIFEVEYLNGYADSYFYLFSESSHKTSLKYQTSYNEEDGIGFFNVLNVKNKSVFIESYVVKHNNGNLVIELLKERTILRAE